MSGKILLVDDDPETVRLISIVLKRQGYEVIGAHDGPTSIHLAQSEQPDLILLDVMMPGMDGYQVTRNLRENPETTNIPILMFSARNQVDDRVAGYESGIDDYLTKPIHPAELVARVKSLITRSKMLGSTFGEKGYTIGILAARGGIGVSTFTLNLGISYRQLSDRDVIAAELRPGHGYWADFLKLEKSENLGKLLRLSPGAITTAALNDQLQMSVNGVQLLVANSQIDEVKLLSATEQMKKTVKLLPLLASLVLLDLGSGNLINLDELIPLCDEIFLLLDPYPAGILSARRLSLELSEWGFGKAKPLSLILVNKFPSGLQSSVKDIEDFLENTLAAVIPPAPEIAIQAETQGKPMLSIQLDSTLNKRYNELAAKIMQTVNNRPN